MKAIAPLLVALCLATPASAQTDPAQTDPAEPEGVPETLEQFAEQMRSLLEGLSDELAPMLEGLNERLRGLGSYEAPEILPNGDIIIRRKPPAEAEPVPDPMQEPDEPVDL
ncbi:MAG: AAA+ family ATPase [Paracoccaceae bacterium]